MRLKPSIVIRAALLVSLLAPVSAFAQQSSPQQTTPPTYGLVASSTGGLGFMWQYSERLGIRPELSWTRSSSDQSTNTSETVSTTTSPAISVLFYMEKWDAVRAYVSPRYAYSHAQSTTTATAPVAGVSTSTTNAHNFSGSVGAEFAAHRHFAAFGEVGLNYGHAKSDNSFSATTASSNTWSIRSQVGAIFYF